MPKSNVLSFPQTATPASDAPARQAALNISRSCIVEAPAGSGKTGLLVQRYLKLLADPAVDSPEEILAITFTRKATAEMHHRILFELEAAHASTPLAPNARPFDRESRTLAEAALARSAGRGWDILTQSQRLNIKTFDSVCVELANALPLLAGSGGPAEPLDDASTLYRLAARRTLMQLGGTNTALHQALHNVLLHRDGNLADAESLLAQMLSTREQWGELIPLGPAALDNATLDHHIRPQLERALESVVCSGLTRALEALPAAALHQLTAFAYRLSAEPAYKLDASPISLCSDKHLPPQAVAAHLDHWRALIGLLFTKNNGWRKRFNRGDLGFEISKDDQSTLNTIVRSIESETLQTILCDVLDLPPTRYPEDQWAVSKSLFHVLRHALAELKLIFAARGECDFAEFSLAAREALAASHSGADLALAAGGRLRHLLVDEMQDTSAAQYDLLERLTASWDGHSQTLFLVGDPKQSIYLFRQARVERFLRTMQSAQLGEIPLQPLRLTANFRSQAALVAGFNQTFDTLFPRPGSDTLTGYTAVDVPFVEAVPDRPATADPAIVWHASIFGEEALEPDIRRANPTTAHHLQEARTIRRLIQHRLATPLPPDRKLRHGKPEPWRIAILTRARTHLAAIVAELKTAAIPFRAVDIDPLGERPEVLDALALIRALRNPADRIAWLAVLHGPACSLTLTDLLLLTGEAPATDPGATVDHLVATRRHLLSPTGQQLLDRAWPVLAAAVKTLGPTSLSLHVERTWRSLGGDSFLTPEEHSNVLRLFALLRELEATSAPIDLDLLSTRLEQLFAAPLTGDISVEILTIHRAKGLEWDFVLVPGLERQGAADRQQLLQWLEFDEAPADADFTLARILLAPISSKGTSASQLTRWLQRIQGRRSAAERKRLLYVAATRAKEELHLFAALERKSSGELSSPKPASILKDCWPAAEPFFAHHIAAPGAPQLSGYLDDEPGDYPLALAASATPNAPAPTIQRLPLTFNPIARFTSVSSRLSYPPASTLPRSAFDRPEGSFAVRAFGNVVHRYLQLLAARLITATPETLLAELPTWLPRLTTSLRGEGLSASEARTQAARAQRALQLTLSDPTGCWLLAPHPSAASEADLTLGLRTLRVDRTFLAGTSPLTSGTSTLWIVDFKTTEPGSFDPEAFAQTQRATYSAQLETYAAARRELSTPDIPIQLGLYFPLIPRLIHWPSQPPPAS